MRNIAVFAPATAGNGAPLLLTLGGPGRSARYALDSWRELADQEGFVVAAVSSASVGSWAMPQDGPGFLRAVVQHLQKRHQIDPRRVYLFGAGIGGGFALSMAALQPRYFAAVGSFGGQPRLTALGIEQIARALPVRVFISKRMPQFDADELRQQVAMLGEAGADVEVKAVDTGPDFERKGRKVAGRIWQALSGHVLSEPPRYESSPFDR